MSILPEAARACVGVESKPEIACEAVERGAVRRYAQAVMDEDLLFRFRAMNVVGEMLWTRAPVTDKRKTPDFGLVDLELGIVNEHRKESTPDKATVAPCAEGTTRRSTLTGVGALIDIIHN